MPYKDPEKKKQYYERHKKRYEAEYKKKNREKWNAYQKEQAKKRRESMDKGEEWDKLKQKPEQYQRALERQRLYWNDNKEDLNEKYREQAKKLDVQYIIRLYRKQGVPADVVKNSPSLIQRKKVEVLQKRIIKLLKKTK